MQIIVEIPDKVAQRVLDACCTTWGYQPDTDGAPSQQDFIATQLLAKLRRVTIGVETSKAQAAQIAKIEKDVGF